MRAALLIAISCIAALPAIGCSKEAAHSSTTAHRASLSARPLGTPRLPTVPEIGPFAAGRKVYNTNGCPGCHLIDSKTGGESKTHGGPHRSQVRKDLTTVGADYNRGWILDHVRNPAIHRPDSRMPAYEKKINEKDLGALADFLANQKGVLQD